MDLPFTLVELDTSERTGKKAMIIDLLESIIIAALVCGFVYLFIVTPNIIKGPSMEPTFYEGQLVLTTSRIAHWLSDTEVGKSLGMDYNRGEVIVFHTSQDGDLIKRIIGLPGETVSIKEGHVYINGAPITETYLSPDLLTKSGTFLSEGEEIFIPEGRYFVLGDHRLVSKDSRDSRVALVNKDTILGKVIIRYWPLPQFSILRPGEIIK